VKMRAIITGAACAALLAACGGPPVVEDVRIEIGESSDEVAVIADTHFEMRPTGDQARRRVDAARAAAIAGTDPWGVRFANLRPSVDSTYVRRERGVLARLTRTVTIPADDLQLVFADTNITVRTLRGDGWRELAFHPGSSTRASRDQERHFRDELELWSRSIAAYYRAMHEVYAYLELRPERAEPLFAAMLTPGEAKENQPALLEDEQLLLEPVVTAMIVIAERMDEREDRAAGFAEEADLIYNPFPARITVQVPGSIIAHEGFSVSRDREAVIERIDLFHTLEKLEGKWLTPDPLALLLREPQAGAETIARAERRSTPNVTSDAIAAEIRARLARPASYVVRWRE
jgi:hypothetical protein